MSMRSLIVLALAAASSAVSAQGSEAAPQRMPGVWEMTAILVEKNRLTHNFHVCVTPETDDFLALPGEPRPECERVAWRRDGQYLDFEAECSVAGSRATMKGRFSGDFGYNLQGVLTTTYTPPLDGLAQLTTDFEGRRLASCRAQHTPGEFMTPVR
jgi:hypothetical protein